MLLSSMFQRKFQIFIFCLIAFVSTNASAIDGLIVKTLDYSVNDRWFKTVGSSTPIISVCDTVYKKQYFFISAIINSYDIDNDGNADTEFSILITKPDKSKYFSQEKIPLIKGKITNKEYMQLSNGQMKICFENNDEYGDYGIEVIIYDLNSGKSTTIHSVMTLAPMPNYNDIKVINDEAFNQIYTHYFNHPKPAEALAYYIYYLKSLKSKNENSFAPIFSFFKEIVKNNNFLLPQIIECYKQQDLKTKRYLLYLLYNSDIKSNEFYDSLEGEEQQALEKIKVSEFEDPYGKISNPSQLDMLWGEFLASGSYKPILKLIQTLDYAKFDGEIEKYKKSQKTKEDTEKAMNNVIFKSLEWSLGSNCKQHMLVNEYCQWALFNEVLSDVQKEALKKILQKISAK